MMYRLFFLAQKCDGAHILLDSVLPYRIDLLFPLELAFISPR